MATKRVTITTPEQATAYLESQGLLKGLKINKEDQVVTETFCGRCGGTGFWARGHWNRNGVCFTCDGTGGHRVEHTPIITYAKRARARELDAAARKRKAEARTERMLDGQRDWCEKNTPYGRVTFEEKAELERKERKAKESQSQYLGEPKKRMVFTAQLDHHTSFETMWGETQVWKFIDDDNNIIVWFTSNGMAKPHPEHEGHYTALEKGDRVTFKATVKKHEEYHGVKQTVVTRCSSIEVNGQRVTTC